MPHEARWVRLLVLSMLCLLAPLEGQQGGVGSVIGELHLTKGDFPGRVFVELQLRRAPIADSYSDDEGRFGFYGLSSNVYHVVVQDERFNTVDSQVVLNTSISNTAMVQINLTPRESASNDVLQAPEPGRNPYLIDPAEYRERFPKNAIKEFDKGIAADKALKHDEAIRHYQKAVSISAGFYPAHNNLGSDYLRKLDLKSAEAEFQVVIRLNPTDAAAYFNLGHVYLLTGRLHDSLEEAVEGLRREPKSAFGYFILGSAFQRAGDAAQSERAFRRALELDPKLRDAHLGLVNLYLSQKRNSDASTELKTYLREFPGDSYAPKARDVLGRLGRDQQSNSTKQ